MRIFNEDRSDNTGDWRQMNSNDERRAEAQNNLAGRTAPSRFRRPPRRTDGPVRAKVPSAPSNTPLYEGQACGGQAVSSINSQNYDFSILPCLIREIHNMLTAKETTLARTLPYYALKNRSHYQSCKIQAERGHRLNNVLHGLPDEQVKAILRGLIADKYELEKFDELYQIE